VFRSSRTGATIAALLLVLGCAHVSNRQLADAGTQTPAIDVSKMHGYHIGDCTARQKMLLSHFLGSLTVNTVDFDPIDPSQSSTSLSDRTVNQIAVHGKDEHILFAESKRPVYFQWIKGRDTRSIPIRNFLFIAHPRIPVEPVLGFYILVPKYSINKDQPFTLYWMLPLHGDPLGLRESECGHQT
jgi:hypothetical protein